MISKDKSLSFILIKDGDEVINIGNFDTNNILKVKYVIQPENSSYQLATIFAKIKSLGYKYIQDNLLSGKIILYKNELNKNLINNDNINIDKIISLFIKYYKFENHLKEEIGENNIKVGYIIDRNELELWKNKNYYHIIKKHFLDQSFKDNKDNINKELPEETKEKIFKFLESKAS